MLISEMISELQRVLEDHGDLPVALMETKRDFEGTSEVVYEMCDKEYLCIGDIDFIDVEYQEVEVGPPVKVVTHCTGKHLLIDATEF